MQQLQRQEEVFEVRSGQRPCGTQIAESARRDKIENVVGSAIDGDERRGVHLV